MEETRQKFVSGGKKRRKARGNAKPQAIRGRKQKVAPRGGRRARAGAAAAAPAQTLFPAGCTHPRSSRPRALRPPRARRPAPPPPPHGRRPPPAPQLRKGQNWARRRARSGMSAPEPETATGAKVGQFTECNKVRAREVRLGAACLVCWWQVQGWLSITAVEPAVRRLLDLVLLHHQEKIGSKIVMCQRALRI